MPAASIGDHITEPYSNNGRTYIVKNCNIKIGERETNYLKKTAQRHRALIAIVKMCDLKHKFRSNCIPKLLTVTHVVILDLSIK